MVRALTAHTDDRQSHRARVTARARRGLYERMKLPSIVFTALTLLPLTACLDESNQEALEEEGTTYGVNESALCFYNVNAPVSADYDWNLNVSSPKVFQVNTYGNANCRRVTVGYFNAAEAAVKVNYTGGIQPVFTAANCGDVTVRGRFWYFDNGAWTYVGQRSDTGTWNGFACILPEVSYTGSIIRDEIRVEITTEWGSSTQLPVRVTGDQ